jgi:hypothetical protein
MEMHQVRYFLAVADELNFTRAAERCHVAQPSLTRASLIRQVLLAHDDASTTVPETCRVRGISKSSYYAALREGRRQALETAEAA